MHKQKSQIKINLNKITFENEYSLNEFLTRKESKRTISFHDILDFTTIIRPLSSLEYERLWKDWREKKPILRKTRSRRKWGNGGERCCEEYSSSRPCWTFTFWHETEGSAGWMLHGIPRNLWTVHTRLLKTYLTRDHAI